MKADLEQKSFFYIHYYLDFLKIHFRSFEEINFMTNLTLIFGIFSFLFEKFSFIFEFKNIYWLIFKIPIINNQISNTIILLLLLFFLKFLKKRLNLFIVLTQPTFLILLAFPNLIFALNNPFVIDLYLQR